MGFLSSVGGAISGAISAVSSVARSIGNFVTGPVANSLSYVLKAGMEVGSKVFPIIEAVARILGVFRPDEDLDVIGDRALQAADQNIKPENYASHQQYMESLRSFSLDPQRSEDTSVESKKAAGLIVATKGISDVQNIPMDSVAQLMVLAARNSAYFDSTKMVEMLQGGAPFVKNVIDYFHDRLNPENSERVEKDLVKMAMKDQPALDEKGATAEIDTALERVRKGDGDSER